MEEGTENKYYLFKVSTDINFFDLERFQITHGISENLGNHLVDQARSSDIVVQTTLSKELVKECIEKLVPKMLFVNLMMCTDYDIIDTLDCYIDFVGY